MGAGEAQNQTSAQEKREKQEGVVKWGRPNDARSRMHEGGDM